MDSDEPGTPSMRGEMRYVLLLPFVDTNSIPPNTLQERLL